MTKLALAILVFAFTGVSLLEAQSPPAPELFTPDPRNDVVELPDDFEVSYLDYQAVRLNSTILDPSNPTPRTVTVSTSSGRFTFTLDELEMRAADDFTWRGRQAPGAPTTLTVTVYRDAAAMDLRVFDPVAVQYSLRTLPGGAQLLCKGNPKPPWKCGVTQTTPAELMAAEAGAGDIPRSLGPVIIRVAIVWNHDVRNLLGGDNAAHAVAQGDIDLTNNCLNNSAVNAQMQLAHTETISFTENDNYQTMLEGLQVHSRALEIRDQFEADLVGLLASRLGTDGVLGLAWVPPHNPITDCRNLSYGFSVSHYTLANTALVLAHELAHNLGAGHERANPRPDGYTPYAHGYNFSINGIGYHTIMSYGDLFYGTLIPYFSNPNILFTGTFGTQAATGNADNDNARIMNLIATNIAAYRNRNSVQYFSNAFAGNRNGTESCPWMQIVDGLPWLVPGQPGTLYFTGIMHDVISLNQPLELHRAPNSPIPAVIGAP